MTYTQSNGSGTIETNYPMYTCTDEDFKLFHTTETRSRDKVDRLRKANELFCFDWKKAKLVIFGNWERDTEWAAAEIQIMPCESRWTAHDGKIHGGGKHCAWDKIET